MRQARFVRPGFRRESSNSADDQAGREGGDAWCVGEVLQASWAALESRVRRHFMEGPDGENDLREYRCDDSERQAVWYVAPGFKQSVDCECGCHADEEAVQVEQQRLVNVAGP